MTVDDILDVKKIVENKLYGLYSIPSGNIEIKNTSKIGDTWSVIAQAKKDNKLYIFYFSIDTKGNVISFSRSES